VSGTALLCLLVFCNTLCIGAFMPLLPEIARVQGLADWQLGLLAGAFGFARMVADLPAGALAGRFLGRVLGASPLLFAAGLLLLGTGGAFPLLLAGRLLTGLGHTLGTVGGLTALLLEERGRSPSVRLNTFEFAGMLGVLTGLTAVGLVPSRWGWNGSLLLASAPIALPLGLIPALRRRFPDRGPCAGGGRAGAARPATPVPARAPGVVWLMFALGVGMALSWSSVSQFLIPIRGERELGLDRAGISRMLALASAVDLVALLPVGWLADRAGRAPVLAGVAAALALGTWGVGLGGLGLFAAGCALFGLGLAGWMLPLGVIREHTPPAALAWRTGLYRVGVDAAVFAGPLVCGLLGAAGTASFVTLVGALLLAGAARLAWTALR
jgi:MFS family permease